MIILQWLIHNFLDKNAKKVEFISLGWKSSWEYQNLLLLDIFIYTLTFLCLWKNIKHGSDVLKTRNTCHIK